jgi:predicted TPR repeat methyltransferase
MQTTIWRLSLFIVIPLLIAIFAAAEDIPSDNNAKIHEAIRICREKLAVDPHFPKIQRSLAQLLDSQISDDQPDNTMVTEVIELYHAVGIPSPEVMESRLPPETVRFESLVRAGTIANEILHDSSKATSCYISALELDGIDGNSLVAVFNVVMPMLLSSVLVGRGETTIAPNGSIKTSSNEQNLMTALNLCDLIATKCPEEPIVDEYKGATLRKMQNQHSAFQSYRQAMLKSKQAYSDCDGPTNPKECLAHLGTFVKMSILVSAAAREAGIGPEEQMKYLEEAEKYLGPFLEDSSDELDGFLLEAGREQAVELYNNMGIVEKKRGALPQARAFFMKALEVKANDGHALVQLASLEDGTGDDIVSKVTELDTEYVSALFDGYSSRFESELVDVLQYKGHSLVYDALGATWKKLQISLSSINTIVDLGSGTGLLGELIANEMPWVAVHGVDLSQRMIDIARERKNKNGSDVYASVTNGDAVKYLSALKNRSVDSVVASDVFVYIGDISGVLEESARCLVENGLVGFTVEIYEDTKHDHDSGLKLLPSGRFGHSKAHIDNLARSKGFEVSSWKNCVLRQGGGKDVKGAVVILKKV